MSSAEDGPSGFFGQGASYAAFSGSRNSVDHDEALAMVGSRHQVQCCKPGSDHAGIVTKFCRTSRYPIPAMKFRKKIHGMRWPAAPIPPPSTTTSGSKAAESVFIAARRGPPHAAHDAYRSLVAGFGVLRICSNRISCPYPASSR